MTNKTAKEAGAGQHAMDLSTWDRVIFPDDSPKSRLGKRRVAAITAYLGRGESPSVVARRFGFSPSELYRLRQRCLTLRPDGKPYGFEACIPGRRLVEYAREVSSPGGGGGQLTQLFDKHPKIEKLVVDLFLGRKVKGRVRERNMKPVAVWRAFIDACAAAGIAENEYPLNERRKGREALRRFCQRLAANGYYREVVHARHGESAARVADAGRAAHTYRRLLKPYEEVQVDGHRLDLIGSVVVSDWDGTVRRLPLERLWLLVLIDVASRAVLGYTLSLLRNYSSDDVLDCIAHGLTPWSARPLQRTRLRYLPGAGFPSGAVPGCAWRAFDLLSFDNAFAHQSEATQRQISETAFCIVNTNRPRRPLSHAIVERVFGTIESAGLHRLPFTTGNGSDDPRRHKPEVAAAKYAIDLDDLEELVEVVLANYNIQEHKGLNGMSPLDYVRHYTETSSEIVRHILPEHQIHLPLYDRYFQRVVRGSLKTGCRPYVEFMGTRYRNQSLAMSPNLVGQHVTMVVNINDIRTIEAFSEEGVSLGKLKAPDVWMQQPHSLRTRRAILAEMRAATLRRDSCNPLDDYKRTLDERARASAKSRNARLRLEREMNVQDRATSVDAIDAASKRPLRPQRGWISLTRTHD